MKNYRMIVAYDGTRYNGWQKQGDTDNTIQNKLETILSRMTGEKVNVVRWRSSGPKAGMTLRKSTPISTAIFLTTSACWK